MKRLTLTIFIIALFTGIFAPVTTMLLPGNGVLLSTQTAHAQTPIDYTPGAGGGGATPTTTQNPTPSPTSAPASIEDHICTGTLTGCILQDIAYLIPYSLGSWFMSKAASFLDVTLAFTLSSKIYSMAGFVVEGWRVIRDFGNIFIILILLFIALSFILGIEVGHANPKKLLASVVVVAIMINFSFFITEVVIDASNSLALVFYNQITVADKTGAAEQPPNALQAGITAKPVSETLADMFKPQVLQTQQFWDGLKDNKATFWNVTFSTSISEAIFTGPVHPIAGFNYLLNGAPVPGYIVLGLLIGIGVMFFAVAYAFFMAGLAFVGRIVDLWVSIIFSPFAFVSYIIPSLDKKVGKYGWSGWWKSLLSVAFSAPLFVFFLLLISLVAKSNILNTAWSSGKHTSFEIFFIDLVFCLMLIKMLNSARKYVKESAAPGEFGQWLMKQGESGVEKLKSGGKIAAGVGLGVAAGGIAIAGQKTLGAWASRVAANKNLQAKMPTSKVARLKHALATNVAEGSHDVRNTKVAEWFTDKTGIDLDKHLTNAGKYTGLSDTGFGLNTAATAGGHVSRKDKIIEKHLKMKEKLSYNKEREKVIMEKIHEHEKTIEKETTVIRDQHSQATQQITLAERAKEQADAALTKAQKPITGFATAAAVQEHRQAIQQASDAQIIANRNLADAKSDAVTLNDRLINKDTPAYKEKKILEAELDNNKNERYRAYLHSKGHEDPLVDAHKHEDSKTPESRARVRLATHTVQKTGDTRDILKVLTEIRDAENKALDAHKEGNIHMNALKEAAEWQGTQQEFTNKKLNKKSKYAANREAADHLNHLVHAFHAATAGGGHDEHPKTEAHAEGGDGGHPPAAH